MKIKSTTIYNFEFPGADPNDIGFNFNIPAESKEAALIKLRDALARVMAETEQVIKEQPKGNA